MSKLSLNLFPRLRITVPFFGPIGENCVGVTQIVNAMPGFAFVAKLSGDGVRSLHHVDDTGTDTHLLEYLLHPSVADWLSRAAAIEAAQEQRHAFLPPGNRARLQGVFALARDVGERVEDQPIGYCDRAHLPPLADNSQALFAGRCVRIWLQAEELKLCKLVDFIKP